MRRRLTAALLEETPRLQRLAHRKAAEPKAEGDSSAHPGDENFDPEHAKKVIGDLAEEVRKKLADDYDARPPGLQTTDGGDGSLTVVANNPEVGIGIQVTITLLPGVQPPQTQMAPAVGIGPPGAVAPPGMNQQPAPQPGSAGPTQVGLGPQ